MTLSLIKKECSNCGEPLFIKKPTIKDFFTPCVEGGFWQLTFFTLKYIIIISIISFWVPYMFNFFITKPDGIKAVQNFCTEYEKLY